MGEIRGRFICANIQEYLGFIKEFVHGNFLICTFAKHGGGVLHRLSLMRLLCLFLCFPAREKVDKKFIDACVYVKDRMEEVSSPDKEMVRILSGSCFDSL